MPTVVFAPHTGVTREALQAAFAAQNIDARVFFHPLSSLPMFEPQPDNQWAWDVPRRRSISQASMRLRTLSRRV